MVQDETGQEATVVELNPDFTPVAPRPKPRGPCKIWTGDRYYDGTPRTRTPEGKFVPAHRYLYEQRHGPIPVAAFVVWSCDHPKDCTNIDHLYLAVDREGRKLWEMSEEATVVEEAKAEKKARRTSAKSGGTAKAKPESTGRQTRFSDPQIRNIRMRSLAGEKNGEIAADYTEKLGVPIPPQMISHIRLGKIYKDVQLTDAEEAEARELGARRAAQEAAAKAEAKPKKTRSKKSEATLEAEAEAESDEDETDELEFDEDELVEAE